MLKGVFWDSNLFIYMLNEHPDYLPILQEVVEWQYERRLEMVTSTFTVGEVLVLPKRMGDSDLIERCRRMFNETRCLRFDRLQAERFAELRARHPSLKPADAIQLSCASTYQVRYFLTNDSRLSHLSVSGIGKVLSLAEWRPELNGERDDA